MSQESELLSPARVEAAAEGAQRVLDGLNKALLGQEDLCRMVLVAFLARGHVLLEGLPGLGKTELVKALADLLGIETRRLQFTPDLLPGDVTGGHMLEEQADGSRGLIFHPGPVFTNLLLADEINRASPKTQSALLEAMQEHRVTVVGETRTLPRPFSVLATQNPIELEGTYPLPEAQLDRFLFKLDVGQVGPETLATILTERRHGAVPNSDPVMSASELEGVLDAVGSVFLPTAVAGYIAALVTNTHPGPQALSKVTDYVRFGASPRAAIAIAESARAHALLGRRPNVGFDDVRAVAPYALGHRLTLDYRARLDGVTGQGLAAAVIAATEEVQPIGRSHRA